MRRRALALAIGSMAVANVLAEDVPAPAPSVAEAIAREVRAVFAKCHRAVVKVEAADGHGALSGTGFFIDPNGTLLTAYSVGGESRDIVITAGLRKLPGKRLLADPRSGIAILKVDGPTPFLTLGKSRDLLLASPVVAIGYPMDLPISPSFGTIAGLDMQSGGRYFATAHLRANVPVQRGQGGAPLLNMRGEVVGVLISSLNAGSAAFALPVEAALKVHKDFVRFGKLRPGWLGLAVQASAMATEGSTARVDEIFPDAPGEKAGIAKNDVLLAVGDLKITSPDDVRNAAFFTTAEDEVMVKVWRHGEVLDLSVMPADHPSSEPPATTDLPRLQGLPTSQTGALSPLTPTR